MFNLIIIVLALVVLLAASIAGLSYLGPTFTTARAHADGAALVDAGQHFAGAEALYAAQSGGGYLLDGSPGDAMAAFVADGILQAVPAVPSDLRATTPFSITGQPDASVHPYLSLGLDPASDMTRRTCAYLDGLANSQFGCASDLGTMAPYPPADGSTPPSASFWFMRRGIAKASDLAVVAYPGQSPQIASPVAQDTFQEYYQVSGGVPPYHQTLVGGPPEAFISPLSHADGSLPTVQAYYQTVGGPYDLSMITTDSAGASVTTHVLGPFSIAPNPRPFSARVVSPFPSTIHVASPATMVVHVDGPMFTGQGVPLGFGYSYTLYDDGRPSDPFHDETAGYLFGFSNSYGHGGWSPVASPSGGLDFTITVNLDSSAVGAHPDGLMVVVDPDGRQMVVQIPPVTVAP